MSSVHLPTKKCLISTTVVAALGFTALGLALPRTARADIGREGTLHIGAERLFGIVRTDAETEDTEFDGMSISLLWGGAPGHRPYDRPRAAVDYFIIDNLSLGGSLGFYQWSESVEDGPEDDGGGFLFYPRVGYMIDISDRLGFWPRGGFTYVSDGVDDGPEHSVMALSAEAPLVIMLGQELALSVALTIDLGLGGEIENDGPAPDPDHDDHQIGIQVSLDGFL